MARTDLRTRSDCLTFVLFFPCCFPLFLLHLRFSLLHLGAALLLWLVLPFLLSALVVRFAVHSSREWHVFPAEARALTAERFADPFWCSGVRLASPNAAPFAAYAAEAAPEVLPDRRVLSAVSRRFRAGAGKALRVSAFLLPRSSLEAGICANRAALLALAVGDRNLSCLLTALDREGEPQCAAAVVRVGPGGPPCHEEPWPGRWASLQSGESGEQVHAIFAAPKGPAVVEAAVQLNRSSFAPPPDDTVWCRSNTSCVLPFHDDRWPSARPVAVVEVGREDRSGMRLDAECVPSAAAYLLVFVLPPLLLLPAAALLLLVLYRRRLRRETEEWFQAAVNEDYAAMHRGPDAEKELEPIARAGRGYAGLRRA